MKTILAIQAVLGIVVIVLSFAAQASVFYRWNHARSEIMDMHMVKAADTEQQQQFQQALWTAWSPPPKELVWLRWLGLGIAGVAIGGFKYMRQMAKPANQMAITVDRP